MSLLGLRFDQVVVGATELGGLKMLKNSARKRSRWLAAVHHAIFNANGSGRDDVEVAVINLADVTAASLAEYKSLLTTEGEKFGGFSTLKNFARNGSSIVSPGAEHGEIGGSISTDISFTEGLAGEVNGHEAALGCTISIGGRQAGSYGSSIWLVQIHALVLTVPSNVRVIAFSETLNRSRFKKMGANPLPAWDQL